MLASLGGHTSESAQGQAFFRPGPLMTQDPRAFGLPARHDLEFDRIGRALAGINGELAGAREGLSAPWTAEESMALERFRRSEAADVPAGTGRREVEGGALGHQKALHNGRAGSSSESGEMAPPLSVSRGR